MGPFSRHLLLMAALLPAACTMFPAPEDPRAFVSLLHSLLGESGGGKSGGSCPAHIDLLDYDALFTDTGATLTGVGNGVQLRPSTNFGDVDGDGDQDLVVTGSDGATQTAKLYINAGSGNFNEDTGAGLTGVESSASDLGDVDGDGDLDLVIAGDSDGANTMVATLYTNDGAGNFTDAGAGLTGVEKSAAHFLDIDGDGDLDLLISGDLDGTPTSSTIFYTNDGAGNFTASGNRGMTDARHATYDFGDVDGDGDTDILYTGLDGTSVQKIYANDGTGNFTDIGAGITGDSIALALLSDLDGDGDLDAVTSSSSGQSINVYRNDGSAAFTLDATYSLRFLGRGAGIARDVDGDGDNDLLLTGADASASTDRTRLFINRGDGTFVHTSASFTGVQYSAVDMADIDGDNDLDLVVTGEGPAANVYRNNLNASPTIAGLNCNVMDPINLFTIQNTALPDYLDGSFDFADIDGDSDLDLLVTGEVTGPANEARIWRNDGNFNFTDTGSVLTGVSKGDGAFGDVDNDGDVDAVVNGNLYRNDGSGNFTVDAGVSATLQNVGESTVDLADLDGDGDLDLLLTGENGATRYAIVYAGDGAGNFADAGAGLTGVHDGSTALADLDGDGDLDLLITGNPGASYLAAVYRNDGGLTFTNMNAGLTGTSGGGADVADLDGDGDLDLFITGQAGGGEIAIVYRNDGGFAFTNVGAALTGTQADTGTSNMLTDIDNDGDVDLLYAGVTSGGTTWSSHLYVNDGAMNFTRANAGLAELGKVALGMADLDGDGDQDVLLSGDRYSSDYKTVVYRNNTR